MTRTEHPTTSQPQPVGGVVQPTPCAAPLVGCPADAANDPHMSPGAVGKSALLNRARDRMAAFESGQSSKSSQRRIARFRPSLKRAEAAHDASTFDAEWCDFARKLPRLLTVDNGKEFHSAELAQFAATRVTRNSDAADNDQRGAK